MLGFNKMLAVGVGFQLSEENQRVIKKEQTKD